MFLGFSSSLVVVGLVRTSMFLNVEISSMTKKNGSWEVHTLILVVQSILMVTYKYENVYHGFGNLGTYI